MCREVRQSLVDMEEFFDILKTQNSLPSGNIPLPDIPPSLAGSFPAAALQHTPTSTTPAVVPVVNGAASTTAGADNAAALQERLTSHSQASSSNGSNGSSRQLDQQDLVEAALLLEEQQHPQHQQQHGQPHLHNLGSSDYGYGGLPDRSVAISGLGLEVDLEDVRFGYQPERQVRGVLVIPEAVAAMVLSCISLMYSSCRAC